MTLEQRTFISPGDILAVEYECQGCHARYLAQVNSFKDLLAQCPNCKLGLISQTYADSSKRSDEHSLRNFIEALNDLQGRTLMKLRLEIAVPVSSKR
jgi:hypothetical protein